MKSARLTFDATARSADAYYIVGMSIPDAFVGLEYDGKYYAVASSLELGNLVRYSRCDRVYSLEEIAAAVAKKNLTGVAKIAAIIGIALKKIGARRVQVGADMPVQIYLALQEQLGASKVEVAAGPLFPERAIKTAHEQKQIALANRHCAAGIALCAQAIRQAKIVGTKLMEKRGVPLTSESLRRRVQAYFLQNGVEPTGELIIAGGRQACDPHCLGSGPLKAGELIIVDLFAPLAKTHYWGDMTRTFIKGAPSDAQAQLVATVELAQRAAVGAIRPGVTGGQVYQSVQRVFDEANYLTQKTDKGYTGFFHGTGHSLGLECHDMGAQGPRLGAGSTHKLQVGEVYTVEPGLYYPSIGGCRIEDNGVVTPHGLRLLSQAPYDWVL